MNKYDIYTKIMFDEKLIPVDKKTFHFKTNKNSKYKFIKYATKNNMYNEFIEYSYQFFKAHLCTFTFF